MVARRGRTNCDQPTDYATRSRSDQALCVVAKIRNLRQPIVTTIDGQACTLLTVGYVTRALGRSNWTIKHWTRLGLLPPAPFVLRPNIANTRRPLYPAQYVSASRRSPLTGTWAPASTIKTGRCFMLRSPLRTRRQSHRSSVVVLHKHHA